MQSCDGRNFARNVCTEQHVQELLLLLLLLFYFRFINDIALLCSFFFI